MSVTLYEASIPPFIKALKTLGKLLTKGEQHVGEAKVQTLLDSRIIDDMKPLVYQIQRVSDSAKGVAVRLGGIEPEVFNDDEQTMGDLHARLEKTIKFMEKLDGKFAEGAAEKQIEFGPYKFAGKDYLIDFAVPNFYFHYVTAYALLRKEGVPVGKKDYLGAA